MSQVFISYARSTQGEARRVAEALRALGYSVWRDDELPPHRPYDEVIQERLQQAKAVVVLWSEEAARSQWVRSEANVAREAGKIVQVTLDGTAPPMPFEQIHCASLKGRAGALNGADWKRVTEAVAELVGAGSEAAKPVSGPTRSWRRISPRIAVAAVAALVLAGATVGGLWFMRERVGEGGPAASSGLKVAVLPFETLSAGQDIRYFADSLQDEVVGALSGQQIEPVSRSTSAALRGPGAPGALKRMGARLVLDGTARRDGEAMRVRVHLDDPSTQTTLWSREFEAPAKDASVLQLRVAHRVLVVLGCSRQALRPRIGLSDPELVSRYLHACDVFADWDVHTGYDLKGLTEYMETLRSITERAPKFAEAQYLYAVATALGAKGGHDQMAAGLRREAETHLKNAIALEPGSPLSFAGRMLLLPPRDWSGRERLLRQAVAADPASSMVNFWTGSVLAETGRMKEAVQFTRRSSAGAMVHDWGIFDSTIACGVDHPEKALEEIRRARRLIPESVFAQDMEIACLAYAGRWNEVRQSLAGPPAPGAETPYRGAATEDATVAIASGRRADLEKARQSAFAKAKQGPLALTTAIGLLSSEGFVDDAFAMAESYDPDTTPGLSPNLFLFFPSTANMRRDPRFMRLAARIGLVDYWRSSGHWPDFCGEAGLPYDCKAEALKSTS